MSWIRHLSALQVVNTNIIIHSFFIIERSVDSRMLIAIGGQDELAEDAVAIHYIGRVEGDGIIAMLRDVELEGLLLQVAEAVGGHIADVDGRRVGQLGNAHAARAILDVQLHGRELGLVPVAYLVFQRVVAGSQRERRTAVWLALNAIKRFVKSPFRTEFSPLDREDFLPEGIVAKAIDMGEHEGSSFSGENLKSAAMELLDQFECSAERAGDASLWR